MTYLYLSASARSIVNNQGGFSTQLIISVSDDTGQPIKGLKASAFSVIDLQFLGASAPNQSNLNVASVTEIAPSFYSVLLTVGSQSYPGNHILMITVTQSGVSPASIAAGGRQKSWYRGRASSSKPSLPPRIRFKLAHVTSAYCYCR